MIRQKTFIALWSIPLIFIMLLTGCKDTSGAMQTSKPGEPPSPSSSLSADAANNPVTAAEVAQSATPPNNAAAAVNPNDKVSMASVEHKEQSDDDSPHGETKQAPPAKPKIDIQDTYNQEKPTLLGLTLKASTDAVTRKYGKPKTQFVMEDDSDPITVYDYTDFLVGFTQQNQLQFIDVRSGDINPGLNGLKLGQSTADVFKTLGKPDSNTSFVLTYKSKGALLKLDIDPKSDKVNSIKLFAVE